MKSSSVISVGIHTPSDNNKTPNFPAFFNSAFNSASKNGANASKLIIVFSFYLL